MLMVVNLSILHHKLVFLLSHGTFTDSFTVGVEKEIWKTGHQQTSLSLL